MCGCFPRRKICGVPFRVLRAGIYFLPSSWVKDTIYDCSIFKEPIHSRPWEGDLTQRRFEIAICHPLVFQIEGPLWGARKECFQSECPCFRPSSPFPSYNNNSCAVFCHNLFLLRVAVYFPFSLWVMPEGDRQKTLGSSSSSVRSLAYCHHNLPLEHRTRNFVPQWSAGAGPYYSSPNSRPASLSRFGPQHKWKLVEFHREGKQKLMFSVWHGAKFSSKSIIFQSRPRKWRTFAWLEVYFKLPVHAW